MVRSRRGQAVGAVKNVIKPGDRRGAVFSRREINSGKRVNTACRRRERSLSVPADVWHTGGRVTVPAPCCLGRFMSRLRSTERTIRPGRRWVGVSVQSGSADAESPHHLDAVVLPSPNPGSRTRPQPAIDHYDTVSTFRAFRCFAPAVWNSLPKTVLSSDSAAVFKSRLKTFVFFQAFSSSSAH